MKKTRLAFSFLFLSTISLGAVAGAQQWMSPEPSERTVFEVLLSSSANRLQEQLRALGSYDVLGRDVKRNVIRVSLNEKEKAELEDRGFALSYPSFEGLNANAIDKYLSPQTLKPALDSIVSKYPDLAHLEVIGQSHRGRDIYALHLSSGDVGDKPSILFNGMHHARELMTTEVVMHIADVLTSQYGKDAEITAWMDKYHIILVPQVNPDGNDLVHTSTRMWRKNAWTESGKLYGVDLNRNYPEMWNACGGSSGSKSSDTYRGPSAGSEPEVQAMMSLVNATRPVFNISYHSYSELILYPFGCDNVTNNSESLYKEIGLQMKGAVIDDDGKVNTYTVGSPPEILYSADGNDIDWQWRRAGVMSFAMEINSMSLGFQPDYNRWHDLTVKRQEGAWKTLLRRMGGGGVTAKFSNEIADRVTYTIDVASSNGFRSWAESSVDEFHLRPAGLFYHVLDAGNYVIHFFIDGKPMKDVSARVGNDVTDLGLL